MKEKSLRVDVARASGDGFVRLSNRSLLALFVCKRWWKAAGGRVPRWGQTLEADVIVRPVRKKVKKHGK